MTRLSILGCTGSIGTQTLDVVLRHQDKLSVESLSAGKNIDLLVEQIKQFSPRFVCVPDEESMDQLKKKLTGFHGEIGFAMDGLIHAATRSEVTHVIVAVVGSLGLQPTICALQSGKTVALANKETLVAGGHLVNKALKAGGGMLIPVDSEHSAIFQCLKGEKRSEVERILLTASGGPFRGYTKEQLKTVKKEDVLHHPVWKMGNKVTVDSASLMNKGLEVIEAKWLFNLELSQIDVVTHPQGIIHSMVEFIDGSVIAQLGLPDMRTPIQVALSYPDRWSAPPPRLNLAQAGTLTFENPDLETFPLLRLAYESAKVGGTMPAVLNAANEEAVGLFLDDQIHFSEIPILVEQAVKAHKAKEFPSLEEVLKADQSARAFVKEQHRFAKT